METDVLHMHICEYVHNTLLLLLLIMTFLRCFCMETTFTWDTS